MKVRTMMSHVAEAERAPRLCIVMLFAMMLAIAMAFAPASAWAEPISWPVGSDVTATLDDDGTLTISGTGPMVNDIDSSSINKSEIKRIVVKEGVTSICEYAFKFCEFVETVTLPKSLQSIGDWAFEDCMLLNEITIPAGVQSIGPGTFGFCANLTTITLPDTLKSIGLESFTLCPCLKKVNYQGTLAQWKKVSIAAGNNALKNASLSYKKLAQPMKAKAKTATANAKKLKKAKQVIAISKALSFTTKVQGKVTYAKVSGSSKLSIAKATGKISVKKGTKKGTYKMKVKVTAAGTAEYKAGSATLTLKVRVK